MTAGALGIAGVALLVLRADAQVDGVGVAAGLGGAVSMATGVVLTKHWGRPVGLLAFTSWQLVAGGLFLAPLALAVEGPPPPLGALHVAGYAWLAVVGTAVAYRLWFRGVQVLPVAQVSILGLLSPVVAAVTGWLVLDQTLAPGQVAGLGLVLGAVLLGQTGPMGADDHIEPFELHITDAEITDLRSRLGNTRWPDAETVDDWSQGIPLAYVRELCDHWASAYDFSAAQARFNAVPQFRTVIDGIGIHFLHARSPHEGALPLVLTHGWPGSVVEFHEVVAPLVDPTAHGGDAADAFHVVCPSLPGYGWSDKPTEPGWGIERIAAAWAALMARLGYDRYGAQGGDWGAGVTSVLGPLDREHCVGIHLNLLVALPDPETMGDLTPAEQAAIDSWGFYDRWDSGYSKQQSTRPQTLGYGLVDSPAGQLAWIVEKLYAWTDCDGHPENVLARDRMLDNVMAYWLPGTGASSARLYWESFDRMRTGAVDVPVAGTVFPKEIFRPSRRWADKTYSDIRYWSEPTVGGHFAAFEQPSLFVDEVRAAFGTMR